MCGIVGYVGEKQALPILINGLKKLEYRGYDSAGVAFIEDEELRIVKKCGRLNVLESVLLESHYLDEEKQGERSPIRIGIGHTRWATHGAPSDENSHPHYSGSGRICVVHNGIIENYMELRELLRQKGYAFVSETDSEVLAQLIEFHYSSGSSSGDLFAAVQTALHEVEGSYGLGVLCADYPDMMIAARKDSPLVIGLGNHENLIASDIPALLSYTREALILEDREIAILTKEDVKVYDFHAVRVERDPIYIDWDAEAAEKGGFEHFMMKEINEEPKALQNTIAPKIRGGEIVMEGFPFTKEDLQKAKSIFIVACGTAFYAGNVGKYVIEKLCRIPVITDVASEFRYRNPIIDDSSIVIIISQSGETLDTLAAMREAKRRGARTMAIVNVVGSSIAREADYVVYTAAGPEIAVASTKAYNTQVASLNLLAVKMAYMLGTIDQDQYLSYQQAMLEIPEKVKKVLDMQEDIQRFASLHFNAESIFFIGRGLDYALSMEASLKLKEISYIHSEAYPGGELKHGTIALIEKGTLVVCPLTQDALIDKMLSNIQEVKARGAVILGICTEKQPKVAEVCDQVFIIPDIDPLFAPCVAVTPCQIFAYYMAVYKGCDVDKPRNLAKSVTVE